MRPDYFVRIGRGLRLAALFCCFCLTGYSAFRALEGTGPLETAAVARESMATPDRVRSDASVTQLIPIEQLVVGQRVLSENPTTGIDLQFGSDIIRADWRKLTLVAPKRDGSSADVVLLRPLSWLTEQQAEVGGTVYISVPECGIDGHANLLAIEPCPAIEPAGDLGGRIITGTFRHEVPASISLSIAGQADPILCTGNHPVWSEDRSDFVRADSLQPNETLRTTSGTTTVTSLTNVSGSTSVYNLEIHGTHVYHVGTSGVLVHNGNEWCDGLGPPAFEMLDGYSILGRKGIVNGVFEYRIATLVATDSADIVSFLNSLAVLAKNSPTNSLRIIGKIDNPKLLSPKLLERYGFQVKDLGNGVFEFFKRWPL